MSYPTSYRPKTSHTLTVGAAATDITVGAQTKIVRLVLLGATSQCYIKLGGDATLADVPVLAGVYEYIDVRPSEKISVIGTDGELSITEVTK